MSDDMDILLIRFTKTCVDEFAKSKNLKTRKAFSYLRDFKGIDFIVENYFEEHVLPMEQVVQDLTEVCQKYGGNIQ
ncbi:MAG: DUF3791 domain-containing protein [Treponemataceae bacterium]|nr:DUF3791 domain-containing protein [Treponemataceae bacterium]